MSSSMQDKRILQILLPNFPALNSSTIAIHLSKTLAMVKLNICEYKDLLENVTLGKIQNIQFEMNCNAKY